MFAKSKYNDLRFLYDCLVPSFKVFIVNYLDLIHNNTVYTQRWLSLANSAFNAASTY